MATDTECWWVAGVAQGLWVTLFGSSQKAPACSLSHLQMKLAQSASVSCMTLGDDDLVVCFVLVTLDSLEHVCALCILVEGPAECAPSDTGPGSSLIPRLPSRCPGHGLAGW